MELLERATESISFPQENARSLRTTKTEKTRLYPHPRDTIRHEEPVLVQKRHHYGTLLQTLYPPAQSPGSRLLTLSKWKTRFFPRWKMTDRTSTTMLRKKPT